MRVLMLVCLFFTVAHAQASKPRDVIFSYECEQVTNADLAFSCLFDEGALTFQLHTKKEDMSASDWKRNDYELNKLAFRYFQLGGSDFEMRADFWDADKVRVCSRTRKTSYFNYVCDNRTDN